MIPHDTQMRGNAKNEQYVLGNGFRKYLIAPETHLYEQVEQIRHHRADCDLYGLDNDPARLGPG